MRVCAGRCRQQLARGTCLASPLIFARGEPSATSAHEEETGPSHGPKRSRRRDRGGSHGPNEPREGDEVSCRGRHGFTLTFRHWGRRGGGALKSLSLERGARPGCNTQDPEADTDGTRGVRGRATAARDAQ